jgi:hypothetical protein
MAMHYLQYLPSFGVFGKLEMISCLIEVIAALYMFYLNLKPFKQKKKLTSTQELKIK